MGQIIAVANQKGGVGKTTTVVNLGHGLAIRGRRVLLVDLDSQGNIADCLGLEAGSGLYDMLHPDSAQPLPRVITSSGRPNLDVIRSDKRTAILKRTLSSMEFGVYELTETLKQADHDVVLLDCAPSVDILHTAALLAADYLLIPTRLDQLAIKGVRDVLQSLATLQHTNRSSCQLAGILPTFYDRVTKESHEQLTHLAKAFGERVLPPIPQDTQCRVATRYGKTLWEYDPNTRALLGISNGSKTVGGYAQTLERLWKLVR